MNRIRRSKFVGIGSRVRVLMGWRILIGVVLGTEVAPLLHLDHFDLFNKKRLPGRSEGNCSGLELD